MKHFKEKLEIETLKSLTYTQINELLNKLTLENKELTKQLSLYGVGSSTKKTRADRRNEKANIVCREARYQMYKHGGILDNNKLSDLVIDWLKYGLKDCYKRPK
tara:strand:+ start:97 stop:408 length:312 start_codon:yes stop_codon:yes gene_type:complete